jgi:hypothetical protein
MVLTWSHGQDVERKNEMTNNNNNNTVIFQFTFLLLMFWHNTHKANYRDSCRTYEETRPIINRKHKHRRDDEKSYIR